MTPEDTRTLAVPEWATKPSAMESLELAKPYLHRIIAVGLASGELTGEPKLFTSVYKRAKMYGVKHAVAHAGEEGAPLPYVKDALDDLLVERLDHGVRTLEDPVIVARVRREGIPLTECPNSNDVLKVYDRFFNGRRDVVRTSLDNGLKVTINSDDPAFFGGYMNSNFEKA